MHWVAARACTPVIFPCNEKALGSCCISISLAVRIVWFPDLSNGRGEGRVWWITSASSIDPRLFNLKFKTEHTNHFKEWWHHDKILPTISSIQGQCGIFFLINTVTTRIQPWIRARVELFTRPFPLFLSLPPLSLLTSPIASTSKWRYWNKN